MLNQEILSVAIPSLGLKDSVAHALEIMNDFHVAHLPVVSDNQLLGMIHEDSLLNASSDDLELSSLQDEFSMVSVQAGSHILQAVHLVNEFNFTIIPVINAESEYLGAITATDLLKGLGRIISANDPGAIIIIEMEKVNFSFSEISKLVETNDAQITQLNSYFNAASASFFVTLKINKLEISDIIATFQRYEYKIKYYYGEELYENELRSNYNHLMNYLSI